MAESLGEALLYLRTDDQGLDRGIENARGKSEGLGRSFDDTSGKAANLGKAMDGAGASATRFGAVQAQATQLTSAQRAGIVQLNQNVNDMATMYAMGARPMQIFTSQIGQVTQALQLASGGSSRFAAIMGSPWTMAVSSAAVILVPLISNLLGTDDATKKAKDSTLDFTRVLDFRKMSVIEFGQAIDKLNESTKSLMNTQAVALDNQVLNSQKALSEAQRRIQEIDKQIAALGERPTGILSIIPGFGESGITSGKREGLLEQRQKLLADAEKARRSIDEARGELQARAIEESIDRSKGERAEVERQIARLKEMNAESRSIDRMNPTARNFAIRQAGDRYISEAEFQRRLRGLNQQQQDQRAPSSGGPAANRAASVGDMVALLKAIFGAGTRITSTTGGQHTKGSDHYAARAIDFIPEGGMGQYSTAEVQKMLEEAGVTIRRNARGTQQLFGPGRSATKRGDHDDHFHMAWSGSASPEEAQRRAAQAAERAAREAEQEARRVERYNRDLAGLQDEARDLQAQMTGTAEERHRLEREGLDIAIAEQRRRIEASSEYSDAEKANLLLALEKKAALERELLETRRKEELARQALEIAQAMWANEEELLRKQLALTDVRDERRAIERKILEETYKQHEAALQATIASREANDAAKADARDKLSKLNQNKALDRERLDREYESPLDRYRREIVGVGNNVNDEMEQIAVDGLDRLSSGLADVVTGAQSLGEVFNDVANQIIAALVRIAIQQLVIMPLLNALGGGGGGAGGGGVGGIFGSLFAGLFADGGLIPTGSFGIVGEAGPEPIFATAGGVGVLPNSALRSMSKDWSGPGGASVSVPIHIDATGADPAALGRVQASVDRLRAELPGQIVATVQDAGDRRLISARKWS